MKLVHRITILKLAVCMAVLSSLTAFVPGGVLSPSPASASCTDPAALSGVVLAGVKENEQAYRAVSEETGVPWAMLAGIHYRETSFGRTNPGNGQGIFQFISGAGGPYPPGPVDETEFRRQLKFMAERIQDDYVYRGSLPYIKRPLRPVGEDHFRIKDTLFSYNGRSSQYAAQAANFGYNPSTQPYEGSPYVMNRFDCARQNMGIITRDFGTIDGIDTRYGAFVIYTQLTGGSAELQPGECDSKVSNVSCVWSFAKNDGSQFLTSSRAEVDIAISTFGWIFEGVAFYVTNTPEQGTVPTYRLRNNNLHYYTVDIADFNAKMSAGGWLDEGIAFYTYPPTTTTNVSHRTYRLYDASSNQYYWTNDQNDITYLTYIGFSLELNSFNTFSGLVNTPLPPAGRSNVYRTQGDNNYFYTTNLNELETVVRVGFNYEGVLTTANEAASGVPVYRLQKPNGIYFYTTSAAERDIAISSFGMANEGIGFYLDDSSESVYRLTNTLSGKYLYTSNINELMAVTNSGGVWVFEGLIHKTSETLLPVYRFLNLFNYRHFYTVSLSEATRITNRGWKFENIAFYADDSPGVPVYRLLLRDKHFYTTDINERSIAESSFGYIYEGIAFYASDSVTSKPVYRLQGGNDEYFYTASQEERDRAVNNYNYWYEGIAFYLPE